MIARIEIDGSAIARNRISPYANTETIGTITQGIRSSHRTIRGKSGYIASQAAQIDTFINLVYGLLALDVIIAVMGIANTLSLSVYERTREFGLLRAVGASRRQIRSIVRMESEITALRVQGVVIGVVLGWAVVFALRDQWFSQLSVPIFTIAVVLVIAIVCGVLAAARPARRAARLDVLGAIANQ